MVVHSYRISLACGTYKKPDESQSISTDVPSGNVRSHGVCLPYMLANAELVWS